MELQWRNYGFYLTSGNFSFSHLIFKEIVSPTMYYFNILVKEEDKLLENNEMTLGSIRVTS